MGRGLASCNGPIVLLGAEFCGWPAEIGHELNQAGALGEQFPPALWPVFDFWRQVHAAITSRMTAQTASWCFFHHAEAFSCISVMSSSSGFHLSQSAFWCC